MKIRFRIYSILLIILVFTPNYLVAQISEGGVPPSFSLHSKLRSELLLPTYNAPIDFDVDRLQWEDEQVDKNGGIPRFAINIPVSDSIINIQKSGVWTTLNDSVSIWRYTIKAEDAQGLILSYKDFYIPKGGKLFIYNEDKSEILGAYTYNTNPQGGMFATELIYGDEITLEYVSSNESIESPRIIVDEVGYAYNLRGVDYSKASTGLNASQSCMINVNCADGRLWQKQKRGVVMLMVNLLGGWRYCSGSLINNTAQDGKPYVLTANHCFIGNSVPEKTIYYFNYEFDSCSNGSSIPSNTKTQVGSQIVANTPIEKGGDGTLLLLSHNIPSDWRPYFNGWNRTNIPATSGVVIHHPVGDVKKITTYVSPLSTGTFVDANSSSATNAHWRVVYDGRSVTQGGSSGSPIFNQDGLIVGSLTGGSSYCTRPNNPDYFAKLWYNWDQYSGTNENGVEQKMSVFLDPINSGVTSLVGFDPNPPTGIEDVTTEGQKEIVIFPNPVKDILNINTNSIINNISIFDASGKLVYKQKKYNSSTISIPISNWTNGVYSVVVNTENKRITDKFVKI